MKNMAFALASIAAIANPAIARADLGRDEMHRDRDHDRAGGTFGSAEALMVRS
jgi:hypothetical protein